MASKKSKNTGLAIVLLIASVAGGIVMGAYVIDTPAAQHVTDVVKKETTPKESVSSRREQTINRLIPHAGKDGIATFEPQQITIPAGEDPRVYLVNDYLKQLHDKGLGNKNAKLLGIDVRNRIAYADFNRAFDESYGTMDEANVLRGIEATLGQFPEIDKIAFQVDGKAMDTTGNIDLTDPQNVIRPGDYTVQPSMDAA